MTSPPKRQLQLWEEGDDPHWGWLYFSKWDDKKQKNTFVKILINTNTLLPSIAALILEGLEWPFYLMLTILFEKVIVGPNHPSSPPKQETQLFRPAPSTCFTTGNFMGQMTHFWSILPHLFFCCHQGSYEGRWLTIAASGECLMDYVHGI